MTTAVCAGSDRVSPSIPAPPWVASSSDPAGPPSGIDAGSSDMLTAIRSPERSISSQRLVVVEFHQVAAEPGSVSSARARRSCGQIPVQLQHLGVLADQRLPPVELGIGEGGLACGSGTRFGSQPILRELLQPALAGGLAQLGRRGAR